ncbi:ubiquitin carboxyl-terminal hydrolase 2-like [Papaver somniferum]|uniref:ubiquitin carboxyl-terminal hydrolase 2-like n=1 Tax=Papaver somniferum TaxID=3469 RepID=UPI000E703628|nr:ubiquitin carboxyl-terminal hydrolase 2-like [Papaver somniferum]
MGKKIKRKTKNIQNERAVSSDSSRTSLAKLNPPPVNVNNDSLLVVEKKLCSHIFEGVHFDKISSKISSSESVKCRDCREHASERRGGKGRSKHGKKNGAGSMQKKTELKPVWVCLECGHFSCGGVGYPNIPQTHAFQHYKTSRHSCIIQFSNPKLRYCFQCAALIPFEKSDDNGEPKDHLGDIVKAIKGKSSRGSSMDPEDVGGIMKIENAESLVLDGSGRYIVRGLLNLGNTCFFNSVMQNLLSMDPLRDHLMKLNRFAGPLTISLKKLFIETSLMSDSRNGISPKNLFGCICAKAPQFSGYQQQDSHELLRCLLDGLCTEELAVRKLHNTEKDVTSSNSSPVLVEMIFGGQLSSTVSCVECGHSSNVYEPFLDLSLEVPTKKHSLRKPSVLSRPKKKKLPPRREVRKGGKIQVKEKNDGVLVLANTSSAISGNKESSSGPVFLPLMEEALDSISWLDYLGPDAALDKGVLLSQNNDDPVMQASEEKLSDQTDMIQNNSDSQSQVVSANKESTPDLDSSQENSCKDELPSQAPDSKAILLPYKEDISNTEDILTKEAETSLSVAGCRQDTGFDGLGDLFNEPELDSVPNSGSWFGEKSFPENDMLESKFFAGNSTGSDADEIDDKGAPVSIDTCLAHFTKAELLLSSEHGWLCANCSKIMQDQVPEESKECQPTIGLNCQINEGQSSLLDIDENLDRGKQDSDIHSTSTNQTPVSQLVRSDGSTNYSKRKSITEDQESNADLIVGTSNCQVDYSCNANGSGTTVSCINRAENMDSDCSAAAQESGEGEEVDSKSLKVKRDATKRILINSAPSILTIHLKRFSQDTRGRLSKLSGHVNFEETIDLLPYMDPRSVGEGEYKYSLLGIVEHSGTMRGGHYVAYVKGDKSSGKKEEDNEDSTWYYASDSHIREVSLAEVLRSEAYILFYGKR